MNEDFKFILSNFNYFGNSEIFKDALILRYFNEILCNHNLDEDFHSYSHFFKSSELQ